MRVFGEGESPWGRRTTAPGQTERLGAQLAQRLVAGDVVLVRGEVGAGKTCLIRGAARALGVTDPVTSPTFSIGHRYRGEGVVVCHLDLYRLPSLMGEDPALLSDYLGAGRIAFVEWPPSLAGPLADARWIVTLRHAGGDVRDLTVRRVEGARP